MRIGVVGGGTAGFVAAAHLSRRLPQAELIHLYDSRLPPIGVGEGTTPRFPAWFEETTGLDFSVLESNSGATLKRGTSFEGWGCRGQDFFHRFQPSRLVGFHFDALDMVGVLKPFVTAEHVDARVTAVVEEESTVTLVTECGQALPCDYVVDARGFPPPHELEGASTLRLAWVPTNAAMLQRIPGGDPGRGTRAIARPHGWIFQIPLRHATSCGYIYSADVSEPDEVSADFDGFLRSEGVDGTADRKTIRFPNFVRREPFSGRVFRIGNAAAFVEPLEATAIGTSIAQVRALTHLLDAWPDGDVAAAARASYNARMVRFVVRNSLFLAWHYSQGSRYDTEFWRRAATWRARAEQEAEAETELRVLDEYLDVARGIPGDLVSGVSEETQWTDKVLPLLRLYRPYGNFSELNFAQVGHGIGAFS